MILNNICTDSLNFALVGETLALTSQPRSCNDPSPIKTKG